MKWSVEKLVGKTITQVVVVERERAPKQQLFLVFSDATSMEFYGDYFNCARELEQGGLLEILEFLGRMTAKEITVYR